MKSYNALFRDKQNFSDLGKKQIQAPSCRLEVGSNVLMGVQFCVPERGGGASTLKHHHHKCFHRKLSPTNFIICVMKWVKCMPEKRF